MIRTRNIPANVAPALKVSTLKRSNAFERRRILASSLRVPHHWSSGEATMKPTNSWAKNMWMSMVMPTMALVPRKAKSRDGSSRPRGPSASARDITCTAEPNSGFSQLFHDVPLAPVGRDVVQYGPAHRTGFEPPSDHVEVDAPVLENLPDRCKIPPGLRAGEKE